MNKLKRYSLLLWLITSLPLVAIGQLLTSLGAFEKPEGIKRDSYNSEIQLVSDWESSRAIAIEGLEKQRAIAVHVFNADLSPRSVHQLSVNEPEFKSAYPVANYVSNGVHYVLVELVPRTSTSALGQSLDYVVVRYDQAANTCTLASLRSVASQSEETRQIWEVFAYKKYFWILSYTRKARVLELHRFEADKYLDTRSITLNDELERQFVEKGVFSRKTSRADLRFAEPRLDFVPDDVFRLVIGPAKDELVLFRSVPRSDSDSLFHVVRFGVDKLEVKTATLYFRRALNTTRNICLHNDRFLFSQNDGYILSLFTKGLDEPEKILASRSYSASDSSIKKLVTRSSRDVGLWTTEKVRTNSNPLYRFSFGADVAAFAFSGDQNELILGFTKVVVQRSSMTTSVTYHNIAMRLNPETLELYPDPNGPLYEKQSAVNQKILDLKKTEGVKVLSRVTLRDGGELLLGMNPSDDIFRIYRAIPE